MSTLAADAHILHTMSIADEAARVHFLLAFLRDDTMMILMALYICYIRCDIT